MGGDFGAHAATDSEYQIVFSLLLSIERSSIMSLLEDGEWSHGQCGEDTEFHVSSDE
jgi:hypothetical protein